MAEHVLKTLADYWDAVARGEKNFEVRRDDRGFQKGDVLVLRRMEWRERLMGRKELVETRDNLSNARREIRRKVTYVLTGGQLGIEPGYVVLGLKKA